MSEQTIAIDLQVQDWKVPEARAYRAAVKVNPEYAATQIDAAIRESEKEARDVFGDAVDTEGWEPPDDWTPSAMMNVDPDYLLGFAWIPARRDNPDLTWEKFGDEGPSYGDLVSGFWAALQRTVEEAAPLLNREARRKTGQRSKTASSSATSTTGRSKRSTASPSASSAKQSES
jgi:hypothetical protein